MMRADLVKRAGLVAGGILCMALAVVLGLLAIDIARYRGALPVGDVRYRVAPNDNHLWSTSELVPFDLATKVLGVQDDVDFRHAVRAMRLARLDDETVSGPEVALVRNEAQARPEAIASGRGDRVRRSRAANLLGALGLARLPSETQDRVALLQSITSNLRLAIELDPTNAEAKYNLELALQRSTGIEIAEGGGGVNPAPGGRGVKGAGRAIRAAATDGRQPDAPDAARRCARHRRSRPAGRDGHRSSARPVCARRSRPGRTRAARNRRGSRRFHCIQIQRGTS